jgi:8-oxo-dGTP pyrophosphatase MutT (NUDIX family)
MKQIGEVFIEEGVTLEGQFIERRTVRAVILNDQNQVLMLYSKTFDDYTFPGGGIKFMEDQKTALVRELHEELGAIGIEIIKPIGYTIEKRFGLNGSGQVYLQSSTYYLTKIHQFGATSFVGREQEHGLESRWINPEDAIRHNQQVKNDIKHQNQGLRTVLPREEAVLEIIKEIKNESI